MKINDIKEFFGNIRDVLNSPVINTVLIAGLFFILLSFFNRDSNGTIIVTSDPRWTMLWLGVSLFLVGVLLFIFRGEGIRLNKKLHIQDGFSIKFEETQVHLGIGTIQEVKGLDRTAAVVLPANTAFTDDCITDKNSALGAYVLDHFPAQIPEMTEAIAIALKDSGKSKDQDNNYPPGTTVMLPSPWNNPTNVLLTGATIRKPLAGIYTEPNVICECIRNTFELTADKKIAHLRIPVIGSGHGGLEINSAILFILLSIGHYSKKFHHIKSIEIVIIDSDAKKIKDIYKLQLLHDLEGDSL